MSYSISSPCVNCFACQDVCPSKAIYEARPHFLVDAKKCSQCEGEYADPQCGSICPIEVTILNELGEPVNPPGSLTGIPPARLAELTAAGIL